MESKKWTLLTNLPNPLECHQFSYQCLSSSPVPDPGFHIACSFHVSLVSSDLWELRTLSLLCVTLKVLKNTAQGFVECPSIGFIWCLLETRLRACLLGKTVRDETMRPSQGNVNGPRQWWVSFPWMCTLVTGRRWCLPGVTTGKLLFFLLWLVSILRRVTLKPCKYSISPHPSAH